jgi:hypothetical protein
MKKYWPFRKSNGKSGDDNHRKGRKSNNKKKNPILNLFQKKKGYKGCQKKRKMIVVQTVAIAEGKLSALIYILERLIKKEYIVAYKGGIIYKDKVIEEILENTFSEKVKDVRQLLYSFKLTNDVKALLEDLLKE